MTRSTTELLQIGLEATTFVLIRQMLSVAFEVVEVFWPVCGSYSPCADIWTPGPGAPEGILHWYKNLKFKVAKTPNFNSFNSTQDTNQSGSHQNNC